MTNNEKTSKGKPPTQRPAGRQWPKAKANRAAKHATQAGKLTTEERGNRTLASVAKYVLTEEQKSKGWTEADVRAIVGAVRVAQANPARFVKPSEGKQKAKTPQGGGKQPPAASKPAQPPKRCPVCNCKAFSLSYPSEYSEGMLTCYRCWECSRWAPRFNPKTEGSTLSAWLNNPKLLREQAAVNREVDLLIDYAERRRTGKVQEAQASWDADEIPKDEVRIDQPRETGAPAPSSIEDELTETGSTTTSSSKRNKLAEKNKRKRVRARLERLAKAASLAGEGQSKPEEKNTLMKVEIGQDPLAIVKVKPKTADIFKDVDGDEVFLEDNPTYRDRLMAIPEEPEPSKPADKAELVLYKAPDPVKPKPDLQEAKARLKSLHDFFRDVDADDPDWLRVEKKPQVSTDVEGEPNIRQLPTGSKPIHNSDLARVANPLNLAGVMNDSKRERASKLTVLDEGLYAYLRTRVLFKERTHEMLLQCTQWGRAWIKENRKGTSDQKTVELLTSCIGAAFVPEADEQAVSYQIGGKHNLRLIQLVGELANGVVYTEPAKWKKFLTLGFARPQPVRLNPKNTA